MPFWPELIGVVTEYSTVVIALPYVGKTCCAFRDEHAFIPVIFRRFMRHSEWYSGSPTKNLLDDCTHVGKVWSVGKRRETRATDHRIEFGLRPPLHFGEGYHRKCPPQQRARSSLGTSATAIHRNFSRSLEAVVTYYICPARYAISRSDRRYRSRCSINDALKLGRTPPFSCIIL